MKKIKMFSILLLPFLLISCTGTTSESSITSIETKTKLEIQPNEKYLVSTPTTKKQISLRATAPDTVDYNFELNKTDEQQLNLLNPNDLIIGRERILLQPVGVVYALDEEGLLTDEVVDELTPEQTETNFSPIIEMSGSGYGNDDIDLTLYDVPQMRTCYALSNSDGTIQSEYYDVAITIVDDIAPSSFNGDILAINPDISYSVDGIHQSIEYLSSNILYNYRDNDNNTTLSIFYYTDETYTTKTTAEEVINNIRNSDTLIIDNQIQPQKVYYRVFDDNGNQSNNGLAFVTLKDDVAPVLLDKNNVPVSFEMKNEHLYVDTLGFDEDRYEYPDIHTDIVNQFYDKGYKIVDEVDGEIARENIEIEIGLGMTSLNTKDNAGNELRLLDDTSKMIVPEDYPYNRDEFVWYPEGCSEDVHPERGLRWEFLYENELTNEIQIIGPNLSEDEFPINWMGTNGERHIQIPQTMEFYGHNYKVTSIKKNAFVDVPYLSLNETNEPIINNVIDFSNTYIKYIGMGTFSSEDYENTQDIKIIVSSLASNITISGSAFYNYKDSTCSYQAGSIFISEKVTKIEKSGLAIENIYLECSSETLRNNEKNNLFYTNITTSGIVQSTWFFFTYASKSNLFVNSSFDNETKFMTGTPYDYFN